MKNPLVIILLGPPGSGKGTQAEFLERQFHLEYIGSGELLRARIKRKDYTGRKIARVIDRGRRIPTPVIFKMWMDKMELFKKKEQNKRLSKKFRGFIIDGSPRTVAEAELVETALEWYGWNENKKVISIEISPKESIWRLTKRRICGKCKKNFPYIGKWRKIKKCDQCRSHLVTRADDTVKGAQERLRWFKAEVKPVIDYYKKKGILIEINGEQSIEDVFKEISKAIKIG